MVEPLQHLRDRLTAAELDLRQRLTQDRQPRVLVLSRFGLDALGGVLEERWPCERIPGLVGLAGTGEGFLELRRTADTYVMGWEWENHAERPATASECAMPLWLAARLGLRSSLLLASAEPLDRASLRPGIALVRDHIRLFGEDPLAGWPSPREGVRHPQLQDLYDPHLRRQAAQALEDQDALCPEKVAVDRPGPSGATAAEKEALRRLGADVLLEGGLAEAIAARHVGLRHATILLLLGQADPAPAADPGTLAAQADALMPTLARLLETLLPHASQEVSP